MELERARETLPSPTSDRHKAILKNFEDALGGREALVEALQHAPSTKDTEKLIQLLCDPLNDRASLATLCQESRLTIADLWKLFSSAELARSQVLALRKITARLPELAHDVMIRSMTHEDACYVCRGAGTIKDPQTQEPSPCGACRGQGSTLNPPNVKDREHALKMGGLLKDGSGVVVLQQQNTNVSAGGVTRALLDALTESTDRALYPQVRRESAPSTVEGEVLHAENADPATP